VKQKSYFLLIN